MIESGDNFARSLTSEKLIGVHKIWREISAGRIGPRREEVTPARLRGALPWTFLIDAAGDDFRFRFAGERMIQFMGMRLAGTNLSERLGTPFYDGMNRFFGGCVKSKTPLANGPRQVSYPGKEHLEMEVMLLPLSQDGAAVTGLLGAFETWALGTHSSR